MSYSAVGLSWSPEEFALYVGVEFSRLGLVVIDEQHRFGVIQRAALTAKGVRPDVLVMTATPIPRSLLCYPVRCWVLGVRLLCTHVRL